MDRAEALALCSRWLPLWTGNRPDELVAIYAPDVFYRDPARPEGIRGKPALRAYLGRLLAAFPDWVWSAQDVFPIEGGFVLRWQARIPVGAALVEETGLDLVLVQGGLVVHNEVYFDRSALLAAMARAGRT
ncbi:MAG: nuclear transport factor 2 family protein [Deltaproteobacteria bacterium]|nr:nuclear transport factor 2 family protein [Deltaproteobacteria bacterium]